MFNTFNDKNANFFINCMFFFDGNKILVPRNAKNKKLMIITVEPNILHCYNETKVIVDTLDQHFSFKNIARQTRR